MRHKIILAFFALGVHSLSAEEPNFENLLIRIQILEEKVAALTAMNNEPDVDVPNEEQPESNKQGEIIINVLEDGQMVVSGKTVNDEEIINGLKAIAEHFPDQAVRIIGARATKYSDIIRAVDLSQKSGIWNISFAVTK